MENATHSSEAEILKLDGSKGIKALSWGSMLFALLQSLCTAALTISGFRVAIGLTALAAGSIPLPVRYFHRDAIRIPMLTVAMVGAVINLLLLAWIWHLRSRPEAQWRKRELSTKERRSERLQIALAVITLVLVVTETWLHAVEHPHHHQPAVVTVAHPSS